MITSVENWRKWKWSRTGAIILDFSSDFHTFLLRFSIFFYKSMIWKIMKNNTVQFVYLRNSYLAMITSVENWRKWEWGRIGAIILDFSSDFHTFILRFSIFFYKSMIWKIMKNNTVQFVYLRNSYLAMITSVENWRKWEWGRIGATKLHLAVDLLTFLF